MSVLLRTTLLIHKAPVLGCEPSCMFCGPASSIILSVGLLQELEVGQKQHVWVQSQTTFACVAKNEEGQHMCKVLKQKIWVEGVSYELQEIYGMEHASDGRVRTQVCCYGRLQFVLKHCRRFCVVL